VGMIDPPRPEVQAAAAHAKAAGIRPLLQHRRGSDDVLS
jgi:hypothetical protein